MGCTFYSTNQAIPRKLGERNCGIFRLEACIGVATGAGQNRLFRLCCWRFSDWTADAPCPFQAPWPWDFILGGGCVVRWSVW